VVVQSVNPAPEPFSGTSRPFRSISRLFATWRIKTLRRLLDEVKRPATVASTAMGDRCRGEKVRERMRCAIAGQDGDRQKAQAGGFDHHWLKPVDLANLAALFGPNRAYGD
jgi:hypothetical protein